MKLALIVYSERCSSRVMEMLEATHIDYYTRWERALGAGHGTPPHLGATRALGGAGVTNCVMMVAFQQEALLTALIGEITRANAEIERTDDEIRAFVVPLERIV